MFATFSAIHNTNNVPGKFKKHFEGFRPPTSHDWLKDHHAMKKLFSVRTILLSGSLLVQLSTLCFHAHGAAGDVDLSFDPGSGVNGAVSAAVLQPDGKVIIAGAFTTVKGLARSRIARLNVDGSGDGSFNAGTNLDAAGAIFAVATQGDGKVLVGFYGGISRLNSDGSRDTNFNASIGEVCDTEGCYLWVTSIAVQMDDKALITGVFATGIGTNYVQGLARLNANGSVDNTFRPAAGTFWSAPVALQPDGRMLVGGATPTNVCDAHGCYDEYRYSLVRLNADGSPDGTFNAGTGLPWIQKITLQSDGKALVFGSFTNGNLARLNANGSLDGSFSPVTANDIESIAVQSDGNVLIVGGFDIVNGSVRRGIARLDPSGSLEGGFNPGAGFRVLNYPIVQAVVVQSDGRIVIGGSFTSVNSTNHSHLDRLNSDGSLDSAFNPGRQVDRFSALAVQSDGKVLIGGPLTFINGTNRYGSARLNADGSWDSTFVPVSFNPVVGDLGIPHDPADFYFTTEFNAFALQPDGKVLVAGVATRWDCTSEAGCIYSAEFCFVTRHHADGSRDLSFAPAVGGGSYGAGDIVWALAMQPDGKVIMGGRFRTINASNRNAIARLNANGTLDTNSALGIGGSFDNAVWALAVQPDGKVLVNGSFVTSGGTNLGGIGRLNADTSLDTSFHPTPGTYGGPIALQPDGKVIVGLNRLNANGSLDSTFNAGTGVNGSVRNIALQSDGNVLIGGDFTTVNGMLRPYVARLYGDSFPPSLTIARSNASAILSWPVTALNFQVQESTNLALPNAWSPVAQSAVTNGAQVYVTVPASADRKFFRLKSQ